MYTQTNVFPNVFVENAEHNPLLTSPNSEYAVQFALTKEGSYDLDEYKALENLDTVEPINIIRHIYILLV